MDTECGESCSV